MPQSTPTLAGDSAPTQALLQREFLTWRFGLFLHFNLATYANCEWASGYEDPAIFTPDCLDCDQWAQAAQAAGMKYAVLTVKHTEGYCLWPSDCTTHDTEAFTNFRAGRGDIVREFTDAFRARGLKVGLYYCMPGNFSYRPDLGPTPPAGKPNLFGMPPEAAGDFPGFIRRQMTELLTRYGKIDLIWADQYPVMLTPAQWRSIKAHIQKLQPHCVVIGNNSKDFRDTDIYGFERPVRSKPSPPDDNTAPAETCDVLDKRGWFWKGPAKPQDLQDASEIVGFLKRCNTLHSNYLLNVQPDPTGQISGLHLQRLHDIGQLLAR